jgi:hypothetical protein
VEANRDTVFEWFQWLAERMIEREGKTEPVPAHIAHRDWRRNCSGAVGTPLATKAGPAARKHRAIAGKCPQYSLIFRSQCALQT